MYRTLALVLIALAVSNANTQTWTYQNQAGWTASYPDCALNSQSPINITRATLTQNLSTAMVLKGSYTTVSSGLKLKNAGGHTQKVLPKTGENFGTTNFNGKEYTCVQFHSHQPSEHTFDGMRYDMELHFVHQQGTATDFLVLTVFFMIGGEDNPLLTKIKYHTGSSTTDASVDITESVNIWDFLEPAQKNKEFISYYGSFTTPPCTEGVNFVLFRDYLMMSKAQWDGYAVTLPTDSISYTADTGNYRAVNPVNSRVVTLQYGYVNSANLVVAGLVAASAILMMAF
jgi:carbonic anhydrase